MKEPDEGKQDEMADDAYSEAFNEAIPVEDITPTQRKDEKENKQDEIKEEEPPAPAKKVNEPNEQAKEPESDEAYEQRWKTLQGIYRHEKDEWNSEKTKYMAELEELKKKATPEPAENKEDEPSGLQEVLSKLNLTPEQKAQLAEYDDEFDVVSKMEGLKRDIKAAELKAELLREIHSFKKEIQTQLEPANNLVKESAANREEAERDAHFRYIQEYHPDFKKYRDDGSLKEWIESKPAYLQKSMMDVYSQGSAEDIVGLYDGFKEENKIKTDGTVININKAKADRKAALTPPTTRRGAVNASMNIANDFDSAFDEALHKEN